MIEKDWADIISLSGTLLYILSLFYAAYILDSIPKERSDRFFKTTANNIEMFLVSINKTHEENNNEKVIRLK